METITEQERQLPVEGDYDVIVAGGGIAGISAAMAAARGGARVALLEQQYLLGGLATAGLVTIYLPLCDGMGHQVSFGIAEELLRLSVSEGWEAEFPHGWLDDGERERRFRVRYNAQVFAILCEKLLLELGVTLRYGTRVCATLQNGAGDRLTALVIEDKGGRSALRGKTFIDATGDGDLVWQAGEETAVFAQGNLTAGWYYTAEEGSFNLHMLGAADVPDKFKTAEYLERQKNLSRWEGLTGEELTRMMTASHAMTLQDFLKKGEVSAEHALTTLATIPQVRMTRRLVGRYTMDDTEMHREFASSVGMFGDWRKPGPVYELPFETLCCKRLKNVLCAGRNISVTDAMWDISRVIPVCAVSGEAAGTAAAMTDDFHTISIAALQMTLIQNGVRLHEKAVFS